MDAAQKQFYGVYLQSIVYITTIIQNNSILIYQFGCFWFAHLTIFVSW